MSQKWSGPDRWTVFRELVVDVANAIPRLKTTKQTNKQRCVLLFESFWWHFLYFVIMTQRFMVGINKAYINNSQRLIKKCNIFSVSWQRLIILFQVRKIMYDRFDFFILLTP